MVGHDVSLMGVEDAVAFFQAGDNAFDRLGEIVQFDAFGGAAGGEQGCFVDEIGEVGAGEAGGERGDHLDGGLRRQADLQDVDLKDLHPALLVGTIDQHLAIEAAGAQQRGVEDFRPVGGGQQHHAGLRIEAVEFAEQLVQRLFLFVMAAAGHDAAAGAAEGVEFIDEDDGGGGLARLVEQVSHPCGADADEHFDKFGT